MTRAVVFDLDGVLLDSEQLWDEVRREVAGEHGGTWTPRATGDMQGMSSVEWSAYLHDAVGVDLAPAAIVEAVVERVLERYERSLPLVPGAREAVRRMGERFPLGLASSSNRAVIEKVLAVADLETWFDVALSSEEVPRGKPHPDVYLEAARRLQEPPGSCAAVEDSGNGIRSALAAGLHVVAVPNRHFPPPAALLAGADAVVDDLGELTVALVEGLGERGVATGHTGPEDALDEEEAESFPASDPHSEWAGPS